MSQTPTVTFEQLLGAESSRPDGDDDRPASEGAQRPRGRRAATPADPTAGPVYEDTPKWAKHRRRRKILKRRDIPIRFYAGTNGSFKSATAVMDLLPTLRGEAWHCDELSHLHMDAIRDDDGNPVAPGPAARTEGLRLVFSTVEITTPDGFPHPLYRRLDDWRMVLDAEHCDLLFDEVTGIANARDAMSLPRQVQVILDQLRKKDVTLSMTGPSFQRVDTTLRTICKGVIICKGYLPERRDPSARVSAWRRMRLARIRTFDGEDFENFNQAQTRQQASKQHRLRPMFVQWWWGPGSEVFSSYSSKGSVARLGAQNDSGLCLDCGGVRQRQKCSCVH